jgi:hypothetical protein
MIINFNNPSASANDSTIVQNSEARINPALEGTTLNWSVSKAKLFTESGIETNHIAIVRDDTSAILGVHSKAYVPFQNSDLYELLEKVSEKEGLKIVKSGHFESQKVFIQMSGGELNLGGDKVQGMLTACNSFDGSTSLKFGNSNVTISCLNSFYFALQGLEYGVRHTSGMLSRIDDVLKTIQELRKNEAEQFKTIKKMSETPFNASKHLPLILNRLFEIDSQAVIMNAKFNDEVTISSRMKNMINAFDDSLTSEMIEKGDTLWGAFSGVTHFTTHKLSPKKDSTETKLFGSWGQKERSIFGELSRLVA